MKIFLAIGHKGVEDFLKKNKSALEEKLGSSVRFVGEAVYREAILNGVAEFRPDVILIREGLQGSMNLTEILYSIKVNFPDTRIIFIAGDREVGDALLSTIVQLGIYDLLIGSKVNANEMLERIVAPNTLSDVAHLMPKVTVDERTNKKLFNLPEYKHIIESNEKEDIEQQTEEKKEIYEHNIKLPKKEKLMEEESGRKEKNQKEEDKKQNKPLLQEKKGLFSRVFGKSDIIKRNSQVITFLGAKGGVGNSQMAFNTALQLAEKNKVMYIDLNEDYSAIDCIFQLGFLDIGLETALMSLKNEDYPSIEKSISNAEKMLTLTKEDNLLYKTYQMLPKNLDFLFYSQEYMENEKKQDTDLSILKDFNIYLLSQNYDFIVINMPYYIFYKEADPVLFYSNKIFFTITPDYSVLGSHLNQIKLMDKNRINFREKSYYLLNKWENTSLLENDIYKLLLRSLNVDNIKMISIPNVSKDFIDANYKGVPILFKNKNILKKISEIEKIILS